MTSGAELVPASGALRGKSHFYPVRVYYEDTDAGGIVYHANYLRFAERARTEMLRAIGIHQRDLKATSGLIFTVYKGDVHYMRPAHLDDALTVETTLTEISGASVRVRQVIRRDEDGADEDLVQFNAQVACVDSEVRAARLPAELRHKLAGYVVEEQQRSGGK